MQGGLVLLVHYLFKALYQLGMRAVNVIPHPYLEHKAVADAPFLGVAACCASKCCFHTQQYALWR